MPLSFIYVYIGSSAVTLTDTLNKKGSFWEKAEVYYFIVTIALMILAISYIWALVGREVTRYEAEFDKLHPNGFDIKKAQQIELRKLELER